MTALMTSDATKEMLYPPGERNVPAEAMVFALGDVEVSQVNGEEAKTAPFKMTARHGGPIDHSFWGRIEHDFGGMKLAKSRVPVDYNHNNNEVIGFANKFSTDSGHLVASGALTPFKDKDRANEVIYKASQGVPWEASINFGGSGIVMEAVAAGEVAQVNGHEFAGPGYIVREWPLRGIAVCPYGADQWTSTEFNSSGGSVTIAESKEMSNSATAEAEKVVDTQAVKDTEEAAAAQAALEAKEAEAAAAVETEKKVDPEATEPANATAQLSQPFITQFGQVQGSVYFASGMTLQEATSKHCLTQAQEIEDLKTKLAVAEKMPKSVDDAASASMPAEMKKKKKKPAVEDPA